jgi:hypothetical protein
VKQPKRIGKCIYCGTTNPPLTDEHVIPYGFNGDVKLLEASCQECAKITSRFERIILRDSLFVLRAALGSKTRNKKERDVPRPMVIVKDGVKQTIKAHWKDHWKVILLPVFKPPAFLDGRAYSGGIETTHVEVITIPETPGETLKKHDADDVINSMPNPLRVATAYAKLLAKIGYGLAVQKLEMDAIEEAHLVRGILGQSNDLGRWVGCDEQKIVSSTKYQHCATRLNITNGLITVRVKLFDGTEYIVVVGRLREAVQGSLRSGGEGHCITERRLRMNGR